MQLPFGLSITSLAAVSASYDAEDQLRQRILHIVRERDHLCRRLRAMGVNTTDGHANFVYLPAIGRPWREVFGDTRLKARYYPDGAARITVGSRASTQAVLAAVATRPADQIASGSAVREGVRPDRSGDDQLEVCRLGGASR
jgi:histidinol-phosphate aminotransferase